MSDGYVDAYKKIGPRQQLANFMLACEEQLKANDHKGGWENDSLEALLRRLIEEVGELAEAVTMLRSYSKPNEYGQQVAKEAADVANFAMMIADNARRA